MLKKFDKDGVEIEYHFICFDEEGKERKQDDGNGIATVLDALKEEADPVTDVYLVCHGWKGDRKAGIKQSENWLWIAASSAPNRDKVRALVPGYKPLLVGLHWPSQAWGDESEGEDEADAGLLGGAPDGDDAKTTIDWYVNALGVEGEDMRDAVTEIVNSASEATKLPPELDPLVVAAYEKLAKAAGRWSEEGEDTQGDWTAQRVYDTAQRPDADAALLGGSVKDTLLAPLRQLSFWTMKARAREVGETGVAKFLRDMQVASKRVRIHLMGHSFGCIVVSAAVAGKPDDPLLRPVSSLFLVQGALSLWSYSKIGDQDGYFRRIVDKKLVAGPILTTWSIHDKAVGNLYPIAARVARQANLDGDYPKYGGTGAFGLQGGSNFAIEKDILGVDGDYGFEPGKIYNIKSQEIIAKGGGFSGAHSDIVHPEVAHLGWAGILTGIKAGLEAA